MSALSAAVVNRSGPDDCFPEEMDDSSDRRADKDDNPPGEGHNDPISQERGPEGFLRRQSASVPRQIGQSKRMIRSVVKLQKWNLRGVDAYPLFIRAAYGAGHRGCFPHFRIPLCKVFVRADPLILLRRGRISAPVYLCFIGKIWRDQGCAVEAAGR